MKKLRKKKCENCKKMFQPERQFQACCGIICAIAYNNKKKALEKNKAKLEYRKNDKTTQAKLAQKFFNEFIRLRDRDEGCISCENNTRQMHAGHYRPAGSNPHLRFNEDNCHKQCSICNNFKSGNLVAYRKNLIKKIGIKRVEALENNKDHKKYTLEDYKKIIKKYRKS